MKRVVWKVVVIFIQAILSFFAINKSIKTESNKVEKEVLLEVANPIYSALQKKYTHLNYIIIIDDDTKKDLPVHFILGQGIMLK